MRTIDFSPVFRSTVGFDRMARLVDAAYKASESASQPAYPPYNIERVGDEAYRITMAVAGFSDADIEVTVKENSLVIAGKVDQAEKDDKSVYLHRGIATRAFERRFDLADHIVVTGAALDNGLLHVDLVREVPEEKRPRKIAIGAAPRKLAGKAA